MSKIDERLLEILVCPVSKKTLEQVEDELICYESKLGYPIKDGIPIKAICKVNEYLDQKDLSLSILERVYGRSL